MTLLLDATLDLEVLSADTRRFVPVDFRPENLAGAVEADDRDVFSFPPAPTPVRSPEAAEIPDARTDRDRLDFSDGTDDVEFH